MVVAVAFAEVGALVAAAFAVADAIVAVAAADAFVAVVQSVGLAVERVLVDQAAGAGKHLG